MNRGPGCTRVSVYVNIAWHGRCIAVWRHPSFPLCVITKTTESEVFCSYTPLTKSPRHRPWVRWTKGFCLWFLGGFWFNRLPNECSFYFIRLFLGRLFLEFVLLWGTNPALISLFTSCLCLFVSFCFLFCFHKLFTVLLCTFELYHLQTITPYLGNHNNNVIWPIIQQHYNGIR